jgi:crotonobetainyl-CoA:carnitine CoA-transferase CaiB-like acyl-CoA transferase
VTLLQGTRVLDLGRYVAAPYCSLVLADLGAEIVRVERPGGEADRTLGLRASNGESYVFASLARNKKGVTLDLRAGEQARMVLHDLIGASDVLLHNFAPPAAAALGLGYDEVRAVRPDIVYVAISSFGSRGPAAGRTGFDPIAQVASGAAAVTGDEDGGPLRAGIPWVDYATGLSAAVGTLAALLHRAQTGEGQEVACALLRTAVSFTSAVLAEAAIGGCERPRLGNQPAHVGAANLYPCADGHVYVAAVSPAAWRAVARLAGAPELGDDAQLATPEQRFERRADVDAVVAGWTARRTVEEAVAALDAARVPCAAYVTPAQVVGDAQVLANDMLAYVDLEQAGLERVPACATPVAWSALEPPATARPPRPGEHNEALYGELLGYGPERLAGLREAGVI